MIDRNMQRIPLQTDAVGALIEVADAWSARTCPLTLPLQPITNGRYLQG